MRITKEHFHIDIRNQSVEVPTSGGARQSALAPLGVILEYLHDDTKTLVDVFRKGQELSNDGPCLGWRDSSPDYRWMKYSEVIERSKNISYGLVRAGMKRGQGSCVGIYCKNCVEWVLFEQACYLQSAVLVPLYDTLGPDACKYALYTIEAELLLCDNKKKALSILNAKERIPTLRHIVLIEEVDGYLRDLAAEKGVIMHHLKDIEESGKQKSGTFMLPSPTDLATICFTSGTTGNPKGVMIEHGQIVMAVDAMHQHFGIGYLGVGDRMISYLPAAHLFERLCEIVMYSSGGSVGFFRGEIKLLFEDINALKPTFFPGVPRIFNKIFDRVHNELRWNPLKRLLLNVALLAKHAELESGIIRDDSLWDFLVLRNVRSIFGGEMRLMLSSAAPLRCDVLSFFRCLMGCPVIETYGQTETCAISSTVLGDNETGIVGPPFTSCFIKLIDVPDMGYYACNGEGEVLIKGPTITRGYFKEPEKTAELINEEGWLQTGDIGRWSETGALAIIDRKKHLVKLPIGENVSPEKVENIYLSCPYIEQIFVHGDSLENYIVAIAAPNKEQLMSWCSQQNIYAEWEDICENKVVKAHILKELNDLGKKFGLKSFEQVKALHLHPKQFSLQNGCLTETMKLKRNDLRRIFKDDILRMFQELRHKT